MPATNAWLTVATPYAFFREVTQLSKQHKLSIVVTIVDGGRYLRDFLQAVTAMKDAPPLEIIIPYDASIRETKLLATEFPDIKFVEMGVVVPTRPIQSQGGQHQLYDCRRACGLARATGDIVAMLEDRGHPNSDWASTLMRLHDEHENNVIGGAIECREPVNLLHWAFYVTDFGRYGRPFKKGSVSWVSDVNVSYKRKALDDSQHLWTERFYEMIVHRYLMSRGEKLYLSEELVVNHARPPVTLRGLLKERLEWGILFGYVRTKQTSPVERLGLILGSPLIAPVLVVRHGLIQAQKGRGLRYLRAVPYVVLMTMTWTVGEVWGYITRRP
jgi:hypothetical protein